MESKIEKKKKSLSQLELGTRPLTELVHVFLPQLRIQNHTLDNICGK